MKTNLQHHMGRQLAEARERREVTREQLAERTGFDLTFIVQIEAGECAAAIDDLATIADAIGVSLISILAEH